MAFVQVTRGRGITKSQYDAVTRAAYGGKLAEGEIFRVAGPGKDAWYVIDGWVSRELCDRSGEKLMSAFQKTGIPMPSMAVEEFDIHQHLKAEGG